MEAEDIAQETYLIALEEWEKVKYHPNPTGWLMMTAKNLCMGYHRHIYYRMVTLEERKDIGYEEPAFDMLVMEDLFENIFETDDESISPDDVKASVKYLETGKYKECLQDMRMFDDVFTNPDNDTDMESEIKTVCDIIRTHNGNAHLLVNKHAGYLLNNAPCYSYVNDEILLFVFRQDNNYFNSVKDLYKCLCDMFKSINEAGIAYMPFSMECALYHLWVNNTAFKTSVF